MAQIRSFIFQSGKWRNLIPEYEGINYPSHVYSTQPLIRPRFSDIRCQSRKYIIERVTWNFEIGK